jgi:hypothetical protein
MTFEILRAHLGVGLALPDVTHDTAAVAAAVGVQDENGQAREARWERWTYGGFMQCRHGPPSFPQDVYLALVFFLPRQAGCQREREASAGGHRC